MKIGLIAIAGVKLQTRKFIDLGITLPQFVNRGQRHRPAAEPGLADAGRRHSR